MLPVRATAEIHTPTGDKVQCRGSMVYLGSSLAADGHIGCELNRRLGAANADFLKLQRVWRHAQLSIQRKLAIFDACICSKLSYGLSTACLTQVERRRLDGFHARCLRKLFRIAPSYFSRISNDTVRQRARRRPMSQQLLQAQCLYFGELARRNSNDPTRSAIFKTGELELRQLGSNRRRGRPRLEWGKSVHQELLKMTGSSETLHQLLASERRHFVSAVRRHFSK